MPKAVNRSGYCDKHNCPQRDSIPGPRAPQSDMLPLDHCDQNILSFLNSTYRHLGNKYEYIVNLHGAEAYRGGLRHSLLEMEEPVGHRYDAIVPGYNAMHICFLLSFNC